VHQSLPLPLNPGRLIAALDRPAQAQRPALTLDAQKRIAGFEGREAGLTRIEFRLIEALQEQQPADATLESLLESVWGTTVGVGTSELVRTHVRNLRQKLSQIGLPDAIRTHRGHGYALEV
jgi:two-component system OmpR family response regulator